MSAVTSKFYRGGHQPTAAATATSTSHSEDRASIKSTATSDATMSTHSSQPESKPIELSDNDGADEGGDWDAEDWGDMNVCVRISICVSYFNIHSCCRFQDSPATFPTAPTPKVESAVDGWGDQDNWGSIDEVPKVSVPAQKVNSSQRKSSATDSWASAVDEPKVNVPTQRASVASPKQSLVEDSWGDDSWANSEDFDSSKRKKFNAMRETIQIINYQFPQRIR